MDILTLKDGKSNGETFFMVVQGKSVRKKFFSNKFPKDS
jgi:antitoxin component YwqK of YwqJK toxin-antitoxin module